MAINKNGHLSGRVGNTINYQLNGKDIVKIVAGNVYDPKTPGQQTQRKKIKTAGRFLKSFYNFIQIGYQATSLDYPSNEARQYLLKNSFQATDDGPVLDYQKVVLSRGLLKVPEDINYSVEDGSLLITWTKPLKSDGNADDKVMVNMYWEETTGAGQVAHAVMINDGTRRGNGSVTVKIAKHSTPVNVWMSFYNPEGAVGESRKKISDSVWIDQFE